MMFDTLVGSVEEEMEDDKFLINEKMKKDPILQCLHTYQASINTRELLESATDPDLSWDETDLPSRCIQVWSFNDFMEQYNQIYTWLNSIQVQYHAGKKKEGNSPRVDGLLKDLERDVQRRERFLRECGRMVRVHPELEGEVSWRLEHVISKWDMLTNLRTKTRKNESDLPDIYSDIELEVRCLRKWLKEMEVRINPVQFNKAEEWNTRDRERKMAEYQVLQTDIESHGRIVKLVLGLCEDLSSNPGNYDLAHALKVAKSLEKRYLDIWIRSLEWQCLLEQWIQDPKKDTRYLCDLVDSEEEPMTKIPRLDQLNSTPNFSPAATLLRVKRRKRWIHSPRELDHTLEIRDPPERRQSPRARRRIVGDRRRSEDSAPSEPEEQLPETLEMRTSETESSDPSPMRTEDEQTPRTEDERLMKNLTSVLLKLEEQEQKELEKMSRESVPAPLTYWDTSDEEAFSDTASRDMHPVSDTVMQSNLSIHASNLNLGSRTVSETNLEKDLPPTGRKLSYPLDNQKPFLHSTPTRTLSYSGGEGNLEVFSLDSLEITELDSFRSTRLILAGFDDSLEDVSSRDAYQSRSSSQDFSLENLAREEVSPEGIRSSCSSLGRSAQFDPASSCSGQLLRSSSSGSSSVPSEVLDQGKIGLELGNFNARKGKKKNRRRLIPSCGDESQSDIEMDSMCSVLLCSSRDLESFHNNLVRGGVDQYDKMVEICSENINLLFNLQNTVKRENSFIYKKKTRETRMLLGEWEKVLEEVSLNYLHLQQIHQIQNSVLNLRERIMSLLPLDGVEGEGKEGEGFAGGEDDLNIKLNKYKDNLVGLERYKIELTQLNLDLQTLSAQQGRSAQPTTLLAAGQLQEEITGLYSLWERCHHLTSTNISATEETLIKFNEFEAELISLKNSLSKDAMRVRSSDAREGSCDSGISDASTENDFPLREQQLERLRFLAQNLEQSLDPRSKACSMISKTIETTSYQLKDLQISLQTLKSAKLRTKSKFGGRKVENRIRPKNAGNSRRRRVTKMALTIHLIMMLVMFISWLTQPRCCDNIGSISMVPQLKYVNGPPPI